MFLKKSKETRADARQETGDAFRQRPDRTGQTGRRGREYLRVHLPPWLPKNPTWAPSPSRLSLTSSASASRSSGRRHPREKGLGQARAGTSRQEPCWAAWAVWAASPHGKVKECRRRAHARVVPYIVPAPVASCTVAAPHPAGGARRRRRRRHSVACARAPSPKQPPAQPFCRASRILTQVSAVGERRDPRLVSMTLGS